MLVVVSLREFRSIGLPRRHRKPVFPDTIGLPPAGFAPGHLAQSDAKDDFAMGRRIALGKRALNLCSDSGDRPVICFPCLESTHRPQNRQSSADDHASPVELVFRLVYLENDVLLEHPAPILASQRRSADDRLVRVDIMHGLHLDARWALERDSTDGIAREQELHLAVIEPPNARGTHPTRRRGIAHLDATNTPCASRSCSTR